MGEVEVVGSTRWKCGVINGSRNMNDDDEDSCDAERGREKRKVGGGNYYSFSFSSLSSSSSFFLPSSTSVFPPVPANQTSMKERKKDYVIHDVSWVPSTKRAYARTVSYLTHSRYDCFSSHYLAREFLWGNSDWLFGPPRHLEQQNAF